MDSRTIIILILGVLCLALILKLWRQSIYYELLLGNKEAILRNKEKVIDGLAEEAKKRIKDLQSELEKYKIAGP